MIKAHIFLMKNNKTIRNFKAATFTLRYHPIGDKKLSAEHTLKSIPYYMKITSKEINANSKN